MSILRGDATLFLAQTDTTAGLLSRSDKRLAKIKKRDTKKAFLVSLTTFKELKERTRVPSKFKKMVRRAKKTTYIYSDKGAFRVVKEGEHAKFLKKFGWFFSTSANITSCDFDFEFFKNRVDVVVYTKEGFEQKESSFIYKLQKDKIRRIR